MHAPALRCLLLLAEVHLAAGDPHGALPHVLACLLPAQPGPGHAAGLTAGASTSGNGAAGGAAAGLGEPGVAAGAAEGGAGGVLGAGDGGGGGGGGAPGGRSLDLMAAEALVLLARVWHELCDGQQLEEVLVLLQVGVWVCV